MNQAPYFIIFLFTKMSNWDFGLESHEATSEDVKDNEEIHITL